MFSWSDYSVTNEQTSRPKPQCKQAALNVACESGHLAIAEILYAPGCNIENVDCDMETPLMHACSIGNDDLIKILCNERANFEAVERKVKLIALSIACTKSHTSIVELLCA